MKKLSIYRVIRSEDDHSKILGKETLRVVNVTQDFVGFGDKGTINKSEFQKLAEALEPTCDGWDLV